MSKIIAWYSPVTLKVCTDYEKRMDLVPDSLSYTTPLQEIDLSPNTIIDIQVDEYNDNSVPHHCISAFPTLIDKYSSNHSEEYVNGFNDAILLTDACLPKDFQAYDHT